MPKRYLTYSLIILTILLLAAAVLWETGYFPVRPESSSCDIRVRLSSPLKTFNVGARDKVIVSYGQHETEPLDLPPGTDVKAAGESIYIGGREYPLLELTIRTPGRGFLIYNGKRYRGSLSIVPLGGGKIAPVNTVDIEDYLKGVLPREVYPLWPFSVLKAQAVASRSFAIHEKFYSHKEYYDLRGDTYSQVYGGVDAENYRTSRAVERTAGLVLSWDQEVLPAFFHSCCGGHTRDASGVWHIDKVPLKGVRCPWCRWSPYYKWKARVDNGDIENDLSSYGGFTGRVRDMKAYGYDVGGFVKGVRVISSEGQTRYSVRRFRSIIGRETLKSPKFRIKKYPRFFLFYGKGWGHGVGMCQWGAFGLGLRRWNYIRILSYYYPGASIEDWESVQGPSGVNDAS
jgi:stage II sporulation protein D